MGLARPSPARQSSVKGSIKSVIREFRKSDIEQIRALHGKSGYGFALPDFERIEIAQVVEEDGRVVGWVGAKLEAEIIGIFDPDWATPGERMKCFARLHFPIAIELNDRDIVTATVHVDPQFRGFGRRLSRLGWSQALWTSYFLDVKSAVVALKGRFVEG